MSAIHDERRYAILEGGPLTRAITTGGAQRGTILGEISRSAFMFKSFPMSMMLTHVMRSLTTGPMHSRAFRLAAFVTTSTIVGAAALQAKQIIAGRDPRDMTTGGFWGAAMMQGGALGIYGDLLNSAVNRGGQGLMSTLAGPILGEVGGTVDLARVGIHDLIFGEKRNGRAFGQALAEYVKRWTPGSTLWYSRLATDRLIFDQVQMMIDPNYARAFDRQAARLKRDFGQSFWWQPGDATPARGPDLGMMAGQ
jgi:hypothetical protein